MQPVILSWPLPAPRPADLSRGTDLEPDDRGVGHLPANARIPFPPRPAPEDPDSLLCTEGKPMFCLKRSTVSERFGWTEC
jgi:hypothetical protein